MYEQADRNENCNYLIEINNKQISKAEEGKTEESVAFYADIREIYDESLNVVEFENSSGKLQTHNLNLYLLQQMHKAGYIIDNSQNSKICLELLEGEVRLACNGLVMEYLGNEAPKLACKKKDISKNTYGYYPSLWKYHLVSDKVYKLIREDTFIVLLPEIYSQSQILMAHAKISHILLSIVNEQSGEICNIWLCFDSDYYNKCI